MRRGRRIEVKEKVVEGGGRKRRRVRGSERESPLPKRLLLHFIIFSILSKLTILNSNQV